MDEVENPNLPAAGESSPTLHPVDETEDSVAAIARLAGPDHSPNNEPAVEGHRPPLSLPQPRATFSARPLLKRDSSAPPPQQPPPAPPTQQADNPSQDPPDSLTLADLKRLRSTFPTAPQPARQALLDDQKVYDFEYGDAQSWPVEVEEWFSYSGEEERKLRRARDAFYQGWHLFCRDNGGVREWAAEQRLRRAFVTAHVEVLHEAEPGMKLNALLSLTYVVLGNWEETAATAGAASVAEMFGEEEGKAGARLGEYYLSGLQIQTALEAVYVLRECGGLRIVYETLRDVCEADFASVAVEQNAHMDAPPRRGEESAALWCCLTIVYLFVETARTTKHTARGAALAKEIIDLQPNLLVTLTEIVGRLRWDEQAPVPLTKMLLLAWKTILVCFGGISDIDDVKASLQTAAGETHPDDGPLITASPLDYHLFRQEISSKYPAYQPPPPLFPLEPENNSILPPLQHRRPSTTASDAARSLPATGTHSIMHAPVHIATPAPSPPPSPAANAANNSNNSAGKSPKKQNYQTNQMFPFLYPPLAGLQSEGAHVPSSILEAARLFARRMRATRAMRQLWRVRVDFMAYERGWKDTRLHAEGGDADDGDVDALQLGPEPAPAETEEQRRLRAVGDFYRAALPHLQSVVVVLLRAVLQHVTELVTRGGGAAALQPGISFAETGENGHAPAVDASAAEIDALRGHEVAAKALNAICLLLLKWFKLSHVLQYEYLAQLLLDGNYVPLVLKLWQTQDIGRACHTRLDNPARDFFWWCRVHSRRGAQGTDAAPEGAGRPASAEQEGEEDESEDEAAPPPIKLRRADDNDNNDNNNNSSNKDEDLTLAPLSTPTPPLDYTTQPPSVDELGYPLTPFPPSPLTHFSHRNTFSTINTLRVLQKLTRGKTHRALLLVSYKSSATLKKALRVPVPLLRYYALKLFKTQVPFCGRKWRQSNMKVITAVWLAVPAELRDDWLCAGGGGGAGGGADVDGAVEEALPLEQALRQLTRWWNVREYPGVVGGVGEGDVGFFVRELERMAVLGREDDGGEEEVDGAGDVWHGPVEGY